MARDDVGGSGKASPCSPSAKIPSSSGGGAQRVSAVRVRKARSEDAESAAHILATVAEEGVLATETPVDIDARAQRFRALIEKKGQAALWVLEDGDRMVGHAEVQETHAAGVLSLAMAILADARGRGGGRALMEAILEHARSCGAHKVELEVWPDNGRAIALYASAGFEVEGLRRNHYRRRDGSLRSSLLMARRLAQDEPSRTGTGQWDPSA